MIKVDAAKIMEEILGMKAGLNPDQQVSQTIIMLAYHDALCCHHLGCFTLPYHNSVCCLRMDALCFHIMNAAFCHVMMLHAAISRCFILA